MVVFYFMGSFLPFFVCFIMVQIWERITKFCIAWTNLPPPPIRSGLVSVRLLTWACITALVEECPGTIELTILGIFLY